MVLGKRASKAEHVFSGAMDCGDNGIELGLWHSAIHSVLAVWMRTPFDVWLIVDIGPDEQRLVPNRYQMG